MAHLQKLSPLLTLLLFLALSAGCSYQGSLAPVSCDGPADCPDGSSCIEGICELDLTDVDDQDTEQDGNSDTDDGTEDSNDEAPGECPDNQERCGEECVDLTNDPLHCGECHNNCSDLPLATGLCIDRTCETECAEDLERCGVYCVDLTDNDEHCGACNHTCSDDEACFRSQCLPACEPTLSPFGGGEGTEATPFVICAPHQLQAITSEHLSAHFVLVKPIDLNELGQPFEPIAPTNQQQFSGSFDGAGLAISNLLITEGNNESGLFGVVASEGELKNILLQGGNIVGGERSGALVGINNGTISNSQIKDISISGPRVIGGLVGRNDGEIHNSSADITVNCTRDRCGGLVGFNRNGTITNSSASGTVVSSGKQTGGLVGENQGLIKDSFADSVSVEGSDEYTGGLVGRNYQQIVNSHATGEVRGSANNVGGLVGFAGGHEDCSIYQSSFIGQVHGQGSIKRVGGLVGAIEAESRSPRCSLDQSFADASVDAQDAEHVGGLVGRLNRGTISNSYSLGSVSGDENVGGLIGRARRGTIENCYTLTRVEGNRPTKALIGNEHPNATVTSCYWNSEASGGPVDDEEQRLSNEEFKLQGSFSGWDFNEVWRISDEEGRPELQWE